MTRFPPEYPAALIDGYIVDISPFVEVERWDGHYTLHVDPWGYRVQPDSDVTPLTPDARRVLECARAWQWPQD